MTPDTPTSTTPDPAPEPVPLLRLRDGLPEVTQTDAALADVAARVAEATGPIALDAERASGYRYSARAYLIQLRRAGAGSALIDPTAFEDLHVLDVAFGDAEWILHAASQDLACLREVGLNPSRLFDTELAARLLGYPRVGLATLVETILGRTMRKEHSAADWSKRPLPQPWLEYAALDVEVLLELRAHLSAELDAAGKAEWAAQEFEHVLAMRPVRRTDPWRRTSGIHKVRGRRQLAAVRALWEARDALAADLDTTPGRLVPDSAVVAAANALPRDRRTLLATAGFHGRGAKRHAERWVEALARARALPDDELPPLTQRTDAPPHPRSWADRDPVAAARLATARAEIAALSERLAVPVENLLTPDTLRRVIWRPPPGEPVLDGVRAALAAHGARPWQIDVTAGPIAEAIEHPAPLEN